MLSFSLVPTDDIHPPAGLLVRGAEADHLRNKLCQRSPHYLDLDFAAGAKWAAVFTKGAETLASLPWIGGQTTYLYRVSSGCFCQAGYRPNVPDILAAQLVQTLRRTCQLAGAFALIAGEARDQLYDFSHAMPLGDVNLPAIGTGR